MLSKLQAKWKVRGWQMTLILVTFALGGSLTGLAGRKLLGLTGMEHDVLYYIVYVVVVTAIWPFAVIAVSIPFGQYSFFTKYLHRMWQRMTGKSRLQEERYPLADAEYNLPGGGMASGTSFTQITNPETIMPASKALPKQAGITKIGIFASGGGSNAQKIIDHFKGNSSITIGLIVCNKPGAGVLAIAEKEGIESLLIDKEQFFRGNAYVTELHAFDIDFIVLAGFLWKIPVALIKAYPNKMVNIHPALLPKYGGKGMYGHFVHEAVIANSDAESGITIHYVDEQYDHGSTIFQAKCPVLAGDTPETLAKRVLELEHRHYAMIVDGCLTQN